MARCCAATSTASSSATTRTSRTTPCCISLTIFRACVGNWVTVGHGAIVHACTVGDETLVGMGAVILDGAVVGKQSIIGAKALVTQGTKIPPGSLVLGAPAKVVRKLVQGRTRRAEMVGGEICGQRRVLPEARSQSSRRKMSLMSSQLLVRPNALYSGGRKCIIFI